MPRDVEHHPDARDALVTAFREKWSFLPHSSTVEMDLAAAALAALSDRNLVVRPAAEMRGNEGLLRLRQERAEWAQRAGEAVARAERVEREMAQLVSDWRARAEAAEREREALREALGGVARHIHAGRFIAAENVACATLAASPSTPPTAGDHAPCEHCTLAPPATGGTDDDLPGMWTRADFEGGDPDERSYAARGPEWAEHVASPRDIAIVEPGIHIPPAGGEG